MRDAKPPSGRPAAGDPGSGDSVRRAITIVNERGLHARAAAKFVKLAATFDADIRVVRNDVSVSGLSIMGLMTLAAVPGTDIELVASGADAARAIAELSELVARKFDED